MHIKSSSWCVKKGSNFNAMQHRRHTRRPASSLYASQNTARSERKEKKPQKQDYHCWQQILSSPPPMIWQQASCTMHIWRLPFIIHQSVFVNVDIWTPACRSLVAFLPLITRTRGLSTLQNKFVSDSLNTYYRYDISIPMHSLYICR